MLLNKLLLPFLVICFFHGICAQRCQPRDYGHGSVVCVCNSTYCDNITTSTPTSPKDVYIYTSTKTGRRFNFTSVSKYNQNNQQDSQEEENVVTITISDSEEYQDIKGFGGALTDSAAINIRSLSSSTQKHLLRSYFSRDGIEYNMVRVPMASCDYSTRQYTYLDKPDDFNLTSFALAKEDMGLKIPLLKEIFGLAERNISLYASPWTAPAWMKTNENEIGKGGLKGKAGDKYHKTWANYFIRFFEAYKSQGIDFWGFTVQNEPSNGYLIKSKWQSTGMSAQMQRDFIKNDLGPVLFASPFKSLKLMILDDQRFSMPRFIERVCEDKEASKYVSGVGVHWYWNWLMPASVLSVTHDKFPDKFILATEACNKNPPTESLGSWKDGVKYSNDILDNLNNWAVGWVDWNLCLDMSGGPNWANNFDQSPIIVNATGDEFYKQPMYYHMGHFSKFIKEGYTRVRSTAAAGTDIKFVATKSPGNQFVLVVLNQSSSPEDVVVKHGKHTFKFTIPGDGIQTLTWLK